MLLYLIGDFMIKKRGIAIIAIIMLLIMGVFSVDYNTFSHTSTINYKYLTASNKEVTLLKGKTTNVYKVLNLSSSNVASFKSSNKEIAMVSKKGVVSGIKKGGATISAKTSNGKVAEFGPRHVSTNDTHSVVSELRNRVNLGSNIELVNNILGIYYQESFGILRFNEEN